MGSHRVRHDWNSLACTHALKKEMATHSSVLAWRIPGRRSLVGCHVWQMSNSHRVGHDWSDLAAAAVSMRVFFKAVVYIPCSLWPFCTDCHHRLGPGWAVLLGGPWWGTLREVIWPHVWVWPLGSYNPSSKENRGEALPGDVRLSLLFLLSPHLS